MRNYFSINHMTAGFIGMMVGSTSSIALIFQAARTAGAQDAEISSWMLALGLSIALSSISLSWLYKKPILIGWSTPGAALLITSLAGYSVPEAIGAFLFAAFLTFLSGITGLFERLMVHIPRSIASAMLAGILLHFGINIFTSMQQQFGLVFGMFLTYLIGKQIQPRFVIPLVLMVGLGLAKYQGLLHFDHFHLTLAKPVLTTPAFTWSSIISVGLPLFIVTMTSQNLPGVMVLKANGYEVAVSKIISWLGFCTFVFAPFGCFSINLAAITASICAGKEADENPTTRYKACIFAGICWTVFGLFGATIVSLFANFPQEMILSLAGLALLGSIASSLKTALEEESHREPAIITVLVAASGFSFYGIGAAFWGLIAGLVSLFIYSVKRTSPIIYKQNQPISE